MQIIQGVPFVDAFTLPKWSGNINQRLVPSCSIVTGPRGTRFADWLHKNEPGYSTAPIPRYWHISGVKNSASHRLFAELGLFSQKVMIMLTPLE